MGRRVFYGIQKMISDIEAKRGDIQATILKLNHAVVEKAKELLCKYADRYDFGSHDALIAGSVIIARKIDGLDLTVVTSDRGLKVVLREENVAFYDPK